MGKQGSINLGPTLAKFFEIQVRVISLIKRDTRHNNLGICSLTPKVLHSVISTHLMDIM